MAWTTPKTWAELETLTSADMNLHLKDNLSYLKGLADGFPNYQYIEYTSAISVALTGSWADIVAATPTALQVSITPRSASSKLLVSLALPCSISAAGSLYFSVRVDGSGNVGTSGVNSFNGDFVYYEYVTTLSAVSHTLKPMWQSPSARTLSTLSGTVCRFSVLELGPLG